MDNQKLRKLAELIVLSHTEDIEFLTTWEMMWTEFEDEPGFKDLSHEQLDELHRKLDDMVRSAKVTVVIPE
jgi:hypothetical protein